MENRWRTDGEESEAESGSESESESESDGEHQESAYGPGLALRQMQHDDLCDCR